MNSTARIAGLGAAIVAALLLLSLGLNTLLAALGIVVVNAIAGMTVGGALVAFSWKLAFLLGLAWWILSLLASSLFGGSK